MNECKVYQRCSWGPHLRKGRKTSKIREEGVVGLQHSKSEILSQPHRELKAGAVL